MDKFTCSIHLMFLHSLYSFYFEYYNNVVADESIFIEKRMYKNMPNLARSCFCSISSFFSLKLVMFVPAMACIHSNLAIKSYSIQRSKAGWFGYHHNCYGCWSIDFLCFFFKFFTIRTKIDTKVLKIWHILKIELQSSENRRGKVLSLSRF